MSKIYYDLPADLTEEVYWTCPVQGCGNLVLEEAFKYLGCAEHGKLVKTVRQFENGKLVSEWKAPND